VAVIFSFSGDFFVLLRRSSPYYSLGRLFVEVSRIHTQLDVHTNTRG